MTDDANTVYLAALKLDREIGEHRQNIAYWRLALGLLEDEAEHHDKRYMRQKRREIYNRIHNNEKKIKDLQRRHDYLVRVYERKNRKEGWS